MSKEGRGLIGGAKDNGIQSGVLSEIKRNRVKGKKIKIISGRRKKNKTQKKKTQDKTRQDQFENT